MKPFTINDGHGRTFTIRALNADDAAHLAVVHLHERRRNIDAARCTGSNGPGYFQPFVKVLAGADEMFGEAFWVGEANDK